MIPETDIDSDEAARLRLGRGREPRWTDEERHQARRELERIQLQRAEEQERSKGFAKARCRECGDYLLGSSAQNGETHCPRCR